MVYLAHAQGLRDWNQYVELATLIILYYDYFTTLHLEVERFWKSPFRSRKLGAILFYVNRYFVILASIPTFVFLFSEPRTTSQSASNDTSTVFQSPFPCDAVRSYNLSILVLIQLWIIVQFVVRVHAFYGYSHSILVLLMLPTAGAIVNGLVQIYFFERDTEDLSSVPASQAGCFQSYTLAQAKHMVFFWIGMLVMDLVVVILTLRKTLLLRREDPTGICTLTMEKAVFYYGLVTIIHLANVLISAIAEDDTKALIPLFANIISTILMSHLNLNLRDERLSVGSLNEELDTLQDDAPMHFAARLESELELDIFPVQGQRRSVFLSN